MHCAKCPSICQLSLVENLTALHDVWALALARKHEQEEETTTTNTIANNKQQQQQPLERKWAKKMGMMSFGAESEKRKREPDNGMTCKHRIWPNCCFFFFSYRIFFGRFCCVAKATTATTTTHAKNKLSGHWMMMHQPWVTFNFSCCFIYLFIFLA